ncbi:MAG TPA: CbtB-domain containing protein [Chloroflexota bacterium]|jgi:exosortase/archaeosortase|nr:CbtB-domain containing protein [Chloroflexota bacterium]
MISAPTYPGLDVRRLIPAVVVAVALLYVLALDQGLLLSMVQGNVAFDQNFIHELVHDSRHIAALPCH